MQVQRPAGIAARTGLITGLFIGVLSLPIFALSGVTSLIGVGLIFIAVALVAFGVASYTATRHSGQIRSGVGAGVLAALIAIFIVLCFGVTIAALLARAFPLGSGGRGPHLRRPGLEVTLLDHLLPLALIILVAGLIGGFIGALLGRIGRPRGQASTTQGRDFTPTGGAPEFAPPPPVTRAAGYPPAPDAYTPGEMDGAQPQPYYPPVAPYDNEAPTTITPSGPHS
jgi:hypothetical protein